LRDVVAIHLMQRKRKKPRIPTTRVALSHAISLNKKKKKERRKIVLGNESAYGKREAPVQLSLPRKKKERKNARKRNADTHARI